MPRNRSLNSFAGGSASNRLVGPMVAGIYAARPDQLSLRAAFKLAAMEHKHAACYWPRCQGQEQRADPICRACPRRRTGSQRQWERFADQLVCNNPVEGLTKTKTGWRNRKMRH